MAIFNHTEKQQKAHFFLQFFLLKSSLQPQKSTFLANLTPSLAANLFALIRYSGRATASRLVHTDLDFQHHHCTACWEIATIFDSIHSFPHILHM